MTIIGQPLQSARIKQTLDELKQKVIGTFYILNQQRGAFNLRDILDIINGNRKPAGFFFANALKISLQDTMVQANSSL